MSQLLTKNISTNIIVLPTHKLAAASMVTPEHVIQIWKLFCKLFNILWKKMHSLTLP